MFVWGPDGPHTRWEQKMQGALDFFLLKALNKVVSAYLPIIKNENYFLWLYIRTNTKAILLGSAWTPDTIGTETAKLFDNLTY